MAGSLKDQLLKAGLVTPDRAKKIERQARAEQNARRKGSKPPPDPSAAAQARQRAERLRQEKADRDRNAARERNEKSAARALRAEIKQIILQHDQRVKTMSDDDVAYNFVHGKRIKRIYVPAAQRDQISNGSLVIVNNDGHYHLLPKAAAEKVRARDPKRIIVAHDDGPPEPDSDDEYYARFKVPDDLDW